MSSSSDISNNDKQTSQIYGSGAFGIPSGSTAQRPTNPAPGMLRWNTSTKKIEFYGATSWNNLIGTDNASDLFVEKNAPEILADMDANSHRITNLANPIDPGDAVNKASLDSALTNIDADTLDGYDSSYFATVSDLFNLELQITDNLGPHLTDYNNPHQVTKEQLGLGDYPEDITTFPVSVPVQNAINTATSGGSYLSKNGDTMSGNLDMSGNNIVNIGNFVGMVMFFARPNPPAGFLLCNGAAVSRTTYARLFAAIGTTFGAGNGSTTFNLPDLRGYFIRGVNTSGANGAPTSVLGGVQADAFRSHNHAGSSTASAGAHTHSGTTNTDGKHRHQVTGHGGHSPGDGRAGEIGNAQDGSKFMTDNNDSNSAHSHKFTTNSAGAHTHALNITAEGGAETRPMNMSLLPCIMY